MDYLRRQRAQSVKAGKSRRDSGRLIDEHAAAHLFMIDQRTRTKRSEEKPTLRGLTASNTCIRWVDMTRTMMQ